MTAARDADAASPYGTSPNGTSPNGTSPGGTAPDGTSPNGTSPNGTSPNRTAPDGTSPDESPPTGLSDAELAAERELIARRYPNGVADSTKALPAIPAASITPEPSNAPAPPARVTSAQHHPVAITCPECSASAMVELTRRDALDFCARCDFPLFWARDQVVHSDPVDSNDDALRRLPGTLGRVVIASTPCPHCNEPNLPTATLCVRCGLTLQAGPAPAPPRPRPAPQPELSMEPLEDASNRWWIWLLVVLTLVLVAGIVLLAAQPWQ